MISHQELQPTNCTAARAGTVPTMRADLFGLERILESVLSTVERPPAAGFAGSFCRGRFLEPRQRQIELEIANKGTDVESDLLSLLKQRAEITRQLRNPPKLVLGS